MKQFAAWLLVSALLMACSLTARPTPSAPPTSTRPPVVTRLAPATATSRTVNLHIRITDGQQPVKGTIRLYWPDTGGEFSVGPTSDYVIPVPADGAKVEVKVTAPGFKEWSQVVTLNKPLDLVVRLAKQDVL